MTRKVIIDCAPGIDDALALAVALFDPGLEVLAVTAADGQVTAEIANRNVPLIVETLDPPRLPRIGTASRTENAPAADMRELNGDDGLGNTGLPVARLHQEHASAKLICDHVRSAPEQVSVLCLGPATNLARAFQRDPELPNLIDRIVLAGGSVVGIGDISPVAEFNMYFDPRGSRTVFRSPTTKTLVSLDVARRVPFDMDLINHLPNNDSRAGAMLRHIVHFLFRAYHQHCGMEHIVLMRTVAVVAALHPEWFETREMAGDVEPMGELTTGQTVFDQRQPGQWRPNMEVVVDVDETRVREFLFRSLRNIGKTT